MCPNQNKTSWRNSIQCGCRVPKDINRTARDVQHSTPVRQCAHACTRMFLPKNLVVVVSCSSVLCCVQRLRRSLVSSSVRTGSRALLETAVLQPLYDALEKHGLDEPGILLTFVRRRRRCCGCQRCGRWYQRQMASPGLAWLSWQRERILAGRLCWFQHRAVLPRPQGVTSFLQGGFRSSCVDVRRRTSFSKPFCSGAFLVPFVIVDGWPLT